MYMIIGVLSLDRKVQICILTDSPRPIAQTCAVALLIAYFSLVESHFDLLYRFKKPVLLLPLKFTFWLFEKSMVLKVMF